MKNITISIWASIMFMAASTFGQNIKPAPLYTVVIVGGGNGYRILSDGKVIDAPQGSVVDLDAIAQGLKAYLPNCWINDSNSCSALAFWELTVTPCPSNSMHSPTNLTLRTVTADSFVWLPRRVRSIYEIGTTNSTTSGTNRCYYTLQGKCPQCAVMGWGNWYGQEWGWGWYWVTVPGPVNRRLNDTGTNCTGMTK